MESCEIKSNNRPSIPEFRSQNCHQTHAAAELVRKMFFRIKERRKWKTVLNKINSTYFCHYHTVIVQLHKQLNISILGTIYQHVAHFYRKEARSSSITALGYTAAAVTIN